MSLETYSLLFFIYVSLCFQLKIPDFFIENFLQSHMKWASKHIHILTSLSA